MLKKLASILSMLSLFMIFSAQIIASRKFMISLGIENYFLFFGFWGMVIFYTASGGLKAVVATDVVQAIFFIIIFIFSFVWVFFTLDPIIMSEQAVSIDNPILNSSKIYSWLLMPLFFMIIEQDMGQRCFAAKSPRVVTKATLWAALSVFLVSIIPVYFGVLAKDLGLEISAGSSVLMTVINERTTPLITALVGCAILTAIISTADSLINAISSNLAQDFKLSLSIRSSQFVTVGISILGIVFSFAFTNVVDLLLQSYELSVSCLFVPIFFSLFKKERAILSAALSIGLGAFGFIFFRIVTLPIPGEISAVILSFGGFYLGEFISVVRRVQLSKIHEASMESR